MPNLQVYNLMNRRILLLLGTENTGVMVFTSVMVISRVILLDCVMSFLRGSHSLTQALSVRRV